jgi:protein-disulfide isomerase/uncharacterized membrane protein
MSQSRTHKAIFAIILLGIAGMVLGGMLTVEHVQLKITGEGSGTCEQLSETGCQVTIGRFGSVFNGRLPVAVIGFGGAFAILALAVLAFVRRRNERDALRSVLFALTAFAVLVSGVMAIFSLMEGAFCPLCVSWYGVNIASCITAFLALDRSIPEAFTTAVRQIPKQMGAFAFCAFLLAVGVGWLAYDYSYHMRLGEARWEQDLLVLGAAPGKHPDVEAHLRTTIPKETKDMNSDITTPSTHIFGSGEKVIRMVEFSDIQCPFCKQFWMESKQAFEHAPYKIEVTFVHFPLSFHEYARGAAHAAECARQQGKGWEFLDMAFSNNEALRRVDLIQYATKLVGDVEQFEACLDDEVTEARIAADEGLARKLGFKGTPMLIIDGYRFEGGRDAEGLAKIIEILGRR